MSIQSFNSNLFYERILGHIPFANRVGKMEGKGLGEKIVKVLEEDFSKQEYALKALAALAGSLVALRLGLVKPLLAFALIHDVFQIAAVVVKNSEASLAEDENTRKGHFVQTLASLMKKGVNLVGLEVQKVIEEPNLRSKQKEAQDVYYTVLPYVEKTILAKPVLDFFYAGAKATVEIQELEKEFKEALGSR